MLKPLVGNELWTANKHTMAMGTVQTSLGMRVGVDEDRKPGKTDHPFQAIGWSLNFFFFLSIIEPHHPVPMGQRLQSPV